MAQPERAIAHRHLPALDEANRTFWQSGRDGWLLISRCQVCKYFIHPWAASCRSCHSRDISPEPVSGKGRVATFTINRHPWEPGFTAPFVIAIVELAEQPGLNLMTNIVNCPIESVHIDMPVRIVFEHVEDVWLPLFEPDTDAHRSDTAA